VGVTVLTPSLVGQFATVEQVSLASYPLWVGRCCLPVGQSATVEQVSSASYPLWDAPQLVNLGHYQTGALSLLSSVGGMVLPCPRWVSLATAKQVSFSTGSQRQHRCCHW